MVENKKYTVAIDLGESNVVVVVGSMDERHMITINGVVSCPCEGVKCGMIDNIALVEESVRTAVTQIEESLNIRIMEAYAGISGEFVRFACHTDHVYISQPTSGVIQSDVSALFERMRHVQAPDNEIIMERIPQNYLVDDIKEVKNPVGSFGRRLSSTFNFILCGNTPIQRLENALRKVGIKMLKAFPNALSVAESVLTADEKEEGVAVVNIGGGLTDVTIYYRNVVRYIVTIPMGAISINHDIRSMMIPDKYIETLKCDYGSAVADLVPENKAIRVPGRTPRDSRNIMLYNLAVAIEARMSMLVEFVRNEIAESGYAEKLPYGIVLTGGSAQLNNIEELFRRMIDMEVRVGVPMDGIDKKSLDIIDSPSYATAVGILLRGMEIGGCLTGDNTPLDTTIIAEPQKEEPQKVEPQKVEPPKEEPPKDLPKKELPPREPFKHEEPKIPEPPKGESFTYTPPTRRPYTPPTPVEQKEEQKEALPPTGYTPPTPKKETEKSKEERFDEDVMLDEKIDQPSSPEQEDQFEEEVETPTNREETQNKRPGFKSIFTNKFRGIIDKVSESFSSDGTDNDEI